MRSAEDPAGDPATPVERAVETSRPRSDRDVQSSNPGPADAGEEEALLWDGSLDDIDMFLNVFIVLV